MTLGEGFDGLNRRLELAFGLGGALGSRVRDTEGMQREREGLQKAPIGVVRLFPSRHLDLPCFHQYFGLWLRLIHLGWPWASCHGLLGFRELLMRLSQALANGKRITLHQIMHAMKEVRHTQALQALFGELDQGLGSITDQI